LTHLGLNLLDLGVAFSKVTDAGSPPEEDNMGFARPYLRRPKLHEAWESRKP
jgi:hypothetical protein